MPSLSAPQIASVVAQAAAGATTAAALPLWKQISMEVDDEGLAECLTLAKLQPEVVAYVVGTDGPSEDTPGGMCGCCTLSDFHCLTTPATEAVDLRDLLNGHTPLANRVVFLSRLRQAWKLADKMITAKELGEREPTPPPDREEPPNVDDALSNEERNQMLDHWDAQHSFGFLPELSPAQPLLNRLGREWRPAGPCNRTLLQVGKVGSVLHGQRSKPLTKYSLAGGGGRLKLLFEDEEAPQLGRVLEYLWRVVTLTNAWAFVGAFLVGSTGKVGTRY